MSTEENPDPTAATTRAIALSNVPPVADPTAATMRLLDDAQLHHRELVQTQLDVLAERLSGVDKEARTAREGIHNELRQRLSDLDRANVILAENVNRVPTQLQIAVTTLKELQDVKFDAVRQQALSSFTANNDRFELLDKQTVREKAAADLALAAAFDAQKEAAAATNNANAAAIHKSELATAETIKNLAEAQRAGQQSLADKIEDIKDRFNRVEQLVIGIQSARSGGRESQDDSRQSTMTLIAVAGVMLTIIIAVVTIVISLNK